MAVDDQTPNFYTGLNASLKIKNGSTATVVAYISNWSVEEKKDIIEFTSLGYTTKKKLPSVYSWTASADGAACFEAGGQAELRKAMTAGTEVTMNFHLDETHFLSGTALVESMSVDISAEDKAGISISLSGIGDLVLNPAA